MAKIKQIGMAAGTFSVALGIGFVMQNGDALASRFGAESAPAEPAPFTQTEQLEEVSLEQSVPVDAEIMDTDVETPIVTAQSGVIPTQAPAVVMPEPDVTLAVALPEDAKVPVKQEAPVQLANLDPEVAPEVSLDVESDATPAAELDCVPEMMATAGGVATIDLSLSAPCHVSTAFVIHHQGMMFTAMTDESGKAEMTVPALAEVSVMIAAFDDGNGAVATTTVPDFASYDRAVLQWQGDTAVMLSAYEDGANFGDENHIFAGNPGDMNRVTAAEGGYLVRLGDATVSNALMAEVYTFPSGMMSQAPDVMLIAEAEITANNCGRELNAQSIQISPTGETSALDLRMVMPECDAVGDFLILQNMFEDLTIASR